MKYLALLLSLPLLAFACRAAALHWRANRKPRSGPERFYGWQRREEHRVKREIMRKLMKSGGVLK